MGALDGAETGNLAEASAGLSIAASRNDFYQISILVYTEMNTNTHTHTGSRGWSRDGHTDRQIPETNGETRYQHDTVASNRISREGSRFALPGGAKKRKKTKKDRPKQL